LYATSLPHRSGWRNRLALRCTKRDSGFYIRTVFKEPDQARGNQVQVGVSDSGVGGVYESYGRGWIEKPSDELQDKILKDRDWNEMSISASAGYIVVHVNGTKTAELIESMISAVAACRNGYSRKPNSLPRL
jgi:hypothetical protein